MNIKIYKEEKLIFEKKEIEYKKESEIITFQLENMDHIIDTQQQTLERFNEEFHFFLDFLNEKCTYELKTHQAIFDILVEESSFIIQEKSLEMCYAIETDDEKTKIVIEF